MTWATGQGSFGYTPPDWLVQQNRPNVGVPSYAGGVPNLTVGAGGGAASQQTPNAGILNLLPSLNQQQATYPALGVPGYAGLTQTESGNIASLLNPTDFSDQQKLGAEMAVGGGFQGSQFGADNTLKLTEDEKIRRQQLGSQMLSGAVGRLPGPVNPAQLLGRSQSETNVPPAGLATRYPTLGGGGGPPAPGPSGANPPGAMGTASGGGVMGFLNSLLNPAPGLDAMDAWRQSVGLGGGGGTGFGPMNPTDGEQALLPPTDPNTGLPFNYEGGYQGDVNTFSDNYA